VFIIPPMTGFWRFRGFPTVFPIAFLFRSTPCLRSSCGRATKLRSWVGRIIFKLFPRNSIYKIDPHWHIRISTLGTGASNCLFSHEKIVGPHGCFDKRTIRHRNRLGVGFENWTHILKTSNEVLRCPNLPGGIFFWIHEF